MRVTRPMRALTCAVAALALAGCGSGGTGEDQVPPTATGSLEHLAAEAKCDPDMQTDADTIRQALCGKGDEKYVLATFSTDRGQREWLNTAKDYGVTTSSAVSGSPSARSGRSRPCGPASAGTWRRGPST